jgi:hypothetical protein
VLQNQAPLSFNGSLDIRILDFGSALHHLNHPFCAQAHFDIFQIEVYWRKDHYVIYKECLDVRLQPFILFATALSF